eukprot:4410620-Amphidinium_carterae.1
MCDGPAAILSRVRFLLFGSLLRQLGWSLDKCLIFDLVQGMPIVGEIPVSHVMDRQEPGAHTSTSSLLRGAST